MMLDLQRQSRIRRDRWVGVVYIPTQQCYVPGFKVNLTDGPTRKFSYETSLLFNDGFAE